MSAPHLHSLIGKAISERKHTLFKTLKAGADLKAAVGQFMLDLQRTLSEIVNKVESKGEQS